MRHRQRTMNVVHCRRRERGTRACAWHAHAAPRAGQRGRCYNNRHMHPFWRSSSSAPAEQEDVSGTAAGGARGCCRGVWIRARAAFRLVHSGERGSPSVSAKLGRRRSGPAPRRSEAVAALCDRRCRSRLARAEGAEDAATAATAASAGGMGNNAWLSSSSGRHTLSVRMNLRAAAKSARTRSLGLGRAVAAAAARARMHALENGGCGHDL